MNTKKVIFWVIVVFLGFWLVTDPRSLANAAEAGGGNLWDVTEDLFRGVIRFFGALD